MLAALHSAILIWHHGGRHGHASAQPPQPPHVVTRSRQGFMSERHCTRCIAAHVYLVAHLDAPGSTHRQGRSCCTCGLLLCMHAWCCASVLPYSRQCVDMYMAVKHTEDNVVVADQIPPGLLFLVPLSGKCHVLRPRQPREMP
jgi:hypothetical protein